MPNHANQRIAYFNGRYIPEAEVVIPFRDRGFKFGDAVFDMTRTFGHKPFRLKEHVERLRRSLIFTGIDPKLTNDELIAISEEVLNRNLHLLDAQEDYWLGQRISRGVDAVGDEGWEYSGPTVIVECLPMPLKERAHLYHEGIDVIVPTPRRVAPDAFSPRVKTHNYLNLILGDLKVKARDPKAWAVLLDSNGNLSEGMGSNIFLVTGGMLYTPLSQFVLPGISRQTTIELAKDLRIKVVEKNLDLYDAVTADEVFLTSTSLCICPVRSVDGTLIAEGRVPGPMTKRLTDSYIEMVGCDFVAQYLRYL